MANKEMNDEKERESSFFQRIFVPALVSIIVAAITALMTTYIQNRYERPNLKILGAMPIHLYGSLQGPSGSEYRIHKLALIIKLENSSPTPTIAHMAMFEGCTKLNPIAAEMHLPENEQLPSGTNINVHYEKYEKSIQKISGSAIVRQDSKLLPARCISYVGAVFPLKGAYAYHMVKGSVSFEGNCREIKTSNPNPVVPQVFNIERIHYEFPKALREDFLNGNISMTIFVGGEQLDIHPSLIKTLRSLKIDRWEELAIPQMYENPDTSFPPLKNYE